MRDTNGPGWSQAPGAGRRPDAPSDDLARWLAPRPTPEPTVTAAPLRNGVDGWQPDPFGTHEERFFKHGEPTQLVRDGGVGSYDDAPPPAPSTPPSSPPGSPGASVGAATASTPQAAVTNGASGATSSPASSAVPTATPDEAGWYQLPDQPDMAQYWNGRQWEGTPQLVEEIQHGVDSGQAHATTPQPAQNSTPRSYGGARLVSTVFKVVAWLVILGGIIGAFATSKSLHGSGATHGHVVAVVAGIAVGTILAAASLAFFAYVLDLLIGIASNTARDGASR